jgi:hypothetical protein
LFYFFFSSEHTENVIDGGAVWERNAGFGRLWRAQRRHGRWLRARWVNGVAPVWKCTGDELESWL